MQTVYRDGLQPRCDDIGMIYGIHIGMIFGSIYIYLSLSLSLSLCMCVYSIPISFPYGSGRGGFRVKGHPQKLDPLYKPIRTPI